MFAKPFVHAFDGHRDGISALAINKQSLRAFVSGAHDGEVHGAAQPGAAGRQIRVWDISERRTVCAHPGAHQGAVRGLCVAPGGKSFVSCGADQTLKVLGQPWLDGVACTDLEAGWDGCGHHEWSRTRPGGCSL